MPAGSPAGQPGAANLNGARAVPPGRGVAWRRATLVVVAALTAAGAAVGAGFALSAGGDYQSHAYVLVASPAGLADNGSAVGLAHAYARVARERAVVGPAVAARRLPASTADLDRALSVATSPDAPIIEITGHAANAAVATALTDAASRAFVGYVNRVGQDTGYQPILLSVAGPADVPTAPGLALSIAVGAAAGGALGTGWRLLRT